MSPESARADEPKAVLLVEDNPTDARLMQVLFSKLGGIEFTLRWVETLAEALSYLREGAFAVVLLDLILPDAVELEVLHQVRAAAPDTPVVVLTSLSDETLASQAMQAGAQDYLIKGEVNGRLLVRALRHAIERQRLLAEVREQTQALALERDLLQALMENIPDTVYFKDTASRFTRVNSFQAQALDVAEPGAAIGKTDFDFFDPDFAREAYTDEQRLLQTGEPVIGKVEHVRRADGMQRWVSVTKVPIRDAAGEVVGLVGTSRDVSELKQHERELEVVATVSAALRAAANRAEMLPIILEQSLKLMEAEGAALVMVDDEGRVRVELARGVWADAAGRALAEGGVTGQALLSAQPYWCNQLAEAPALTDPIFPRVQTVACVPLTTQPEALGGVWIGRRFAFAAPEMRIFSAIGNTVANALHRVTLHDQTEQQLRFLAALRTIDAAISGSIDLRLTLRVLLDQITAQLRVHAADVLLLDPHSQTLHYAEGRGFLSGAVRETRLHVGRGHAGRAALERRTVNIPNLQEAPDDAGRARLLSGEKFVAYYATPLIAKGQVKGILEIFHRAALEELTERLDFLETVAGQAAIAIDNATLFEEQQRSNIELRHINLELTLAFDGLLELWARILEQRAHEPDGHTQRVTEVAQRVARRLNLSETDLGHLRRGALLHDLGELMVPEVILSKPGPLADEELQVVRLHPLRAYEWLAPILLLRPALDIPYAHHEKWDGSGYPRGLRGAGIPLAARIFTVVDVWSALRSDRPFRPAWPEAAVKDYLRSQAGRHFDPAVVEAFMQVLSEVDQPPDDMLSLPGGTD